MAGQKSYSLIKLNIGYIDYLTTEYPRYIDILTTNKQLFSDDNFGIPSGAIIENDSIMASTSNFYLTTVLYENTNCQERYILIDSSSYKEILGNISMIIIELSFSYNVPWKHYLFELFLAQEDYIDKTELGRLSIFKDIMYDRCDRLHKHIVNTNNKDFI